MRRVNGAVRRSLPLHALTLAAACAAAGALGVGSPAQAATCSNAAMRTGPSAQLDECRAYEQVSPREKRGVDVDPGYTVQSAPSGDRVLFAAVGAFPGAATSMPVSSYLARRDGGDWQTDPIDPPLTNDAAIVITKPTSWLSEDLGAAVQMSLLALTPDAVAGAGNIYRRDNLTGRRTLLGSGPPALFRTATAIGATSVFRSATPDLSHVLFNSETPLLPGAPSATYVLYELTPTGLRVASVLPPGVDIEDDGFGADPISGGSAITPDGRRVFFVNGVFGAGGLFMRTDGATTQAISVSQRAGGDAAPRPAKLMTVSGDGRFVFFESVARLTDATNAAGSGPWLYRYSIASGELVDLTASSDAAAAGGGFIQMLGASRDGRRVYFSSLDALAPGATAGAPTLYVWDDGAAHVVTRLDEQYERGSSVPASVSPDGRTIVFSSVGQLTGFDNHGPACRAGVSNIPDGLCFEVFVYDAETRALRCPTCVTGQTPVGHSGIGSRQATMSGYVARAAVDDGRAFFETPNALVPRDTNGKVDVYAWHAGALSLISSGGGSSDAVFADASPDGRDVFFATRERLVPQDGDRGLDFYDARVGGGIAAQQVDPTPSGADCTGDACREAAGSPPALAGPATETFRGPGDPAAATGTAPSARVAAPRRVTGRAAQVKVRVSGRGRVTVTGPSLRTASRSVPRAGTYAVRVRLSARGARALTRRARRLVAGVRVTFEPAHGKQVRLHAAITFVERVRAGR